MQTVIQYGGRAAGAYAAFRAFSNKVGGGTLGTVAVIALGWLAGGIVADTLAAKVATPSSSAS